jgi:hypothetical protein
VLTAAEDGIAREWTLPVPVQEDGRRLITQIEALTGLTCDADGVIHTLSPAAWATARSAAQR